MRTQGNGREKVTDRRDEKESGTKRGKKRTSEKGEVRDGRLDERERERKR